MSYGLADSNNFNPLSAAYHYYRIAVRHDERYFRDDVFGLKKFLYFLRGLLGAKWIGECGTPPPVPFRDLVNAMVTDKLILSEIDFLLAKKSRSKESDKERVSAPLASYAFSLKEEIGERLANFKPNTPSRTSDSTLDFYLYKAAVDTKI